MLVLFWISVRTVLCEGGVPQRPVVFVTRKKLVNAIQQKLSKLNGEPGWVTIYGMAGCGKSVLAAEEKKMYIYQASTARIFFIIFNF